MPSSEPETQVNKVRGAATNASERVLGLGQSKPKTKSSESRKDNVRSKVSSPFNFRNLNDPNSSSTSCGKVHKDIPAPQHVSSTVSPIVSSPLEKPLPSLPCATLVTKSPFKAQRSLIDAEEKPLRRSISPKFQIHEDWPTLSPQKQRLAKSTIPSTPPNKPSVSESLIQRIKHLKLEDQVRSKDGGSLEPGPFLKDAALTSPHVETELRSIPKAQPAIFADSDSEMRGDVKEEKTVQKSVGPIDRSPPRPLAAMDQLEPQVLQPKVAEPRNLLYRDSDIDSSDARSISSQDSEPPQARSTIAGRARPVKRIVDAQRNRVAAARARLRSRHHITSSGSPYTLTLPPKDSSLTKQVRNNSLRLESLKIDIDFTSDGAKSCMPEVLKVETSQNGFNSTRKSSIPVPSRYIRNSPHSGKTELSFPKLSKTLIVRNDANSSETESDAVRDNAPVLEPSLLCDSGYKQAPRLMTSVDNAFNQVSGAEGSIRNVPVQESDDAVSGGGAGKASIVKDGDSNISDEDFKVKRLSHNSPEHGPILKISSSANKFILGSESPLARDITHCLKTTNGPIQDKTGISSENCNAQSGNSQATIRDDQSVVREGGSQHSNPNRCFQPEEIEVPLCAAASKQIQTLDQRDLRDVDINEDAVQELTVEPGISRESTDNSNGRYRELSIAPSKINPSPDFAGTSKYTKNDLPETLSADRMQSATDLSRVAVEERSQTSPTCKNLEKSRIPRSPSNIDCADLPSGPHIIPKITRMPRHSSLKPISPSSTGYRSPSTNAANIIAFKQPPVVETPQSQNTRSLAHTKQNLRSATDVDADNGQTSSPSATAGTASAGKGVIKNLKGFFHKRTAQSPSVHSSVRHQSDIKKGPSTTKSKLSSQILDPSSSARLPRSPRVKGTSAFYLPGITSTEPSALRGHTDVQLPQPKPGLTSMRNAHFPSSPQVNKTAYEKPGLEAHQANLTSSPIQANNISQIEPFKFRSREIDSATTLVHHLLDKAKGEASAHRKAELVELSKTLVQILSLARDTERALEKAKQAAAECEKATLMIRKEVGFVNNRVGQIVYGGSKRTE